MQIRNIIQDKIYSIKKKSQNNDIASFDIDNELEDNILYDINHTKVNVDALWMLQNVDQYSTDAALMKQVGGALLGELHQIRMNLIDNNLNKDNIIKLQTALHNSKVKIHFPEMRILLDEIELRVEIELAKLEKILK